MESIDRNLFMTNDKGIKIKGGCAQAAVPSEILELQSSEILALQLSEPGEVLQYATDAVLNNTHHLVNNILLFPEGIDLPDDVLIPFFKDIPF